ncbi:MAG: FAD-dependent oxidoreductase [Ferruginibacter sp.]
MAKKIHRKDFLKLAVLANLSLYAKPFEFLVKEKQTADKNPASLSNVTYYKKGDVEYEKLRQGFNKRIDKYPAVIALCQNSSGVAEAINYAIANHLPVAVKSGGHCMEGFSCNNNGMVINLSLLNKVEWIDNDTIKVGPGCTLSNLYDTILPKGKILPGGSCGGVGIGGLVLGGGYGLLARKFGLACDSLIEVTMIDGTGKLRSSAEDKELLWACRGGGNGNFAVITEMKFKVHKAPATLQSFRFKSHKIKTDRAKNILQKWFELSAILPPGCFSAYVLNGKTVYILLTNVDKNTPEVLAFIKGMSALADKTTQTKAQPLTTALKVFYGQKDPLFFKNSSAGLYKNFADIEHCIDAAIGTVIATPGMIYQVNTLGGNIQNAEAEAAAAFPHRSCIYFSELQTYWQNEKMQSHFLERFQYVQNIFINNGINTQYVNYPDINFKNWETQYYGSNYSRLQFIKNKYDPNDLIRHDQSIKKS